MLHLLFPTRCPVCGEFIGYMERFCPQCVGKLNVYEGSFSIEGAASFTAVYLYDDNIKPAVFLLKDGTGGNADFALGGALADRLKENGIAKMVDVIAAAPMHKKDIRKRGFNQSLLIAKEVSRLLHLPVDTNAVSKVRRTRAQKELDSLGRSINLKNAFAADSHRLRGKRVLVIDDICTTGSTLRELTAAILQSGAASVHCACCCKTPKSSDERLT